MTHKNGIPAASGGSMDSSTPPQGVRWCIELSEAERSHLAFAVLCQLHELEESNEADMDEVLDARHALEDVQRKLDVLSVRSSLWENPQGGRKPRQRLGGIFHRQAAALWVLLGVLVTLMLWRLA